MREVLEGLDLEIVETTGGAAAVPGVVSGSFDVAFGNDPEMRCEPLGLARLITFAGPGVAMEMIQLEDRILQRFEWTWDSREIWMDGRVSPRRVARVIRGQFPDIVALQEMDLGRRRSRAEDAARWKASASNFIRRRR